ncbi:unnamed protein product [Protopolystoma xenopodis]|uniref:Uncharacterized protein n=1 Tax=Protopolystoma xenopodis TaxID=117903 RepID=A0A448WBL5_9PLAT|nr:unnamed protein product [Protopolystoma xenopodis]
MEVHDQEIRKLLSPGDVGCFASNDRIKANRLQYNANQPTFFGESALRISSSCTSIGSKSLHNNRISEDPSKPAFSLYTLQMPLWASYSNDGGGEPSLQLEMSINISTSFVDSDPVKVSVDSRLGHGLPNNRTPLGQLSLYTGFQVA